MKNMVIIILTFFIIAQANATTWSSVEVDDPILKGSKCIVQQPMSSGSYIYQWPSKYDQVFWPFTVKSGIWFCEKSGFIALIGDFEKLTPEEEKAISGYLKNNYSGITGFSNKLLHMEKIYSLRKPNAVFKNRLLRILAYNYESIKKVELANAYRKKALDFIEKSLTQKLPEQQELEYLFLATIYNKQFGKKEKYSQYLSRITKKLEHIDDKELIGYSEYLKPLIKDVERVQVGGVLRPN